MELNAINLENVQDWIRGSTPEVRTGWWAIPVTYVTMHWCFTGRVHSVKALEALRGDDGGCHQLVRECLEVTLWVMKFVYTHVWNVLSHQCHTIRLRGTIESENSVATPYKLCANDVEHPVKSSCQTKPTFGPPCIQYVCEPWKRGNSKFSPKVDALLLITKRLASTSNCQHTKLKEIPRVFSVLGAPKLNLLLRKKKCRSMIFVRPEWISQTSIEQKAREIAILSLMYSDILSPSSSTAT